MVRLRTVLAVLVLAVLVAFVSGIAGPVAVSLAEGGGGQLPPPTGTGSAPGGETLIEASWLLASYIGAVMVM